MTAPERERLLLALADLVERDAELLPQLDSLDSGKPLSAARAGDLPLSIASLRYFAGWTTKIVGDTLSTGVPDTFVYTRKQPVGVVGAIVPWNFPIMQATWQLGPALAAGCTVVLKPAEQTPLSALHLAELTVEAGIPPGVVNVCPGFGRQCRGGARASPRRRQGDIHRIAGGRQADRAWIGRNPEARFPGARRQES